MELRRSSRQPSKKHLASDFDWDEIPPQETEESHLASNTPATKTKTKSPSSTLPDTQQEIARLQLLHRTQELEIKKLEMELQLAKLQAGGNTATIPGIESNKSLGDQKAPQKTLYPQEWPHIFAPGEPKLYKDLNIAEFCAGYLVIIQNCAVEARRLAYITHFHDLMVLAASYRWSAVRSYHYKVLRSIELGLVKWGGSFDTFKQSFFLPTMLLSNQDNAKAPQAQSPPSIPRQQICDAWSWFGDCQTTSCTKQHICVVCKRPDHQARTCPKRKYPVPPRRSETQPSSD